MPALSFRLHRRLVFPRVECRPLLSDQTYRDQISRLIELGVGGFVLFDGTVEQVSQVTGMLRDYSEQPLLLAADCEFGGAMRFDNGLDLPAMMGLGEADELRLTEQVARQIAREMNRLGLDWNFAPVLDVNSNPGNPIINIRSFGSNPELVARHGVAYIRGLQSEGIIACGKHFPGHGDTDVDSHIGMPVINRSAASIRELEFIPFEAAIGAGVQSIMSGHLAVPEMDRTGRPVSASRTILDLLRDVLHFDGVIVTDALDMGALVSTFGAERAVIESLTAGNDVLEIPEDPLAALFALDEAMDEGRLDQERIAKSVERIDRMIEWRISVTRTGQREIGNEEVFEHLQREAFRRVMHVSKSECQEEPAVRPVQIVLFARHDHEKVERNLRAVAPSILGSDWHLTCFDYDAIFESWEDSETFETASLVLFVTSIRPSGGSGIINAGEAEELLVRSVPLERRFLLNLGNPMVFDEIPFCERIDLFGSADVAFEIALRELFE